jgi:hypothetical protein
MSDTTEYERFAERFESAMSAWKFQVESYWTRNSYFAAFETAAAAGVWNLIENKHWWTSLAFSAGLIALTFIWFFNNMRIHEYIDYWWKRAGSAEEAYTDSAKAPNGVPTPWIYLVHDYENNRQKSLKWISYHCLIQSIPILFLICWFCIFCMSIFYLGCNCHQLCMCK